MATSIVRRMREALRWLFTLDEPQWADAEQVDDSLKQDVRFLRFQLTKTRSELTELSQRPDSFPQRFAALFHMPEEDLRKAACRYEVYPSDDGGGWTVVVEHCVFCGCAVKRRLSKVSGKPCCIRRFCKQWDFARETTCRAHSATASI